MLRPVAEGDAAALAATDAETLRLTGSQTTFALTELRAWYRTRADHDDRLDLSIVEGCGSSGGTPSSTLSVRPRRTKSPRVTLRRPPKGRRGFDLSIGRLIGRLGAVPSRTARPAASAGHGPKGYTAPQEMASSAPRGCDHRAVRRDSTSSWRGGSTRGGCSSSSVTPMTSRPATRPLTPRTPGSSATRASRRSPCRSWRSQPRPERPAIASHAEPQLRLGAGATSRVARLTRCQRPSDRREGGEGGLEVVADAQPGGASVRNVGITTDVGGQPREEIGLEPLALPEHRSGHTDQLGGGR